MGDHEINFTVTDSIDGLPARVFILPPALREHRQLLIEGLGECLQLSRTEPFGDDGITIIARSADVNWEQIAMWVGEILAVIQRDIQEDASP